MNIINRNSQKEKEAKRKKLWIMMENQTAGFPHYPQYGRLLFLFFKTIKAKIKNRTLLNCWE